MAELAETDYIVPCEHDSILDPDFVETLLKSADNHDILYGWCRLPNNFNTPNRCFNGKALNRYNYIPLPALINRKLFHKLGGFTPHKQDPLHYFWIKAAQNGARFKCIESPVWTLKIPFATQVARDAVSKYHAVQKWQELEKFIELIESKKPRTVVEIGTAGGGTLWAMAQIVPEARFVSVDIPSGSPIDTRNGKDVYTRPGQEKLASYADDIHFVDGDSKREAVIEQVKDLIDGEGIDLLFIDGDHRYDGARADFDNYSPFMAEGGVIAFHDIVEHNDPRVGVHRLWNEITKNYINHKEFVTPSNPPWGGIGILL